jgi:hypothetical protein
MAYNVSVERQKGKPGQFRLELRMPLEHDVAFADEIGQTYGKYHSTFRVRTDQVLARPFEQNGRLIAQVSFLSGLRPNRRVRAAVESLGG